MDLCDGNSTSWRSLWQMEVSIATVMEEKTPVTTRREMRTMEYGLEAVRVAMKIAKDTLARKISALQYPMRILEDEIET